MSEFAGVEAGRILPKCTISIADDSLTVDNWDIEIHIWSHPDDRLLNILDFLENVE